MFYFNKIMICFLLQVVFYSLTLVEEKKKKKWLNGSKVCLVYVWNYVQSSNLASWSNPVVNFWSYKTELWSFNIEERLIWSHR